MERPKFSIVIVNCNSKDFALPCLKSVLTTDYPHFEVIFVDNASTDGSFELVKKKFNFDQRVSFIRNCKNLGHAEGCNVGSKRAHGKYVVFLDSDTLVTNNWLIELARVLESDADIGAAQCKLLLIDDPRRIDSAGAFMNRFGIVFDRGHNQIDEGQFDREDDIFGGKGAALVVRKDILREVGGYDGDFFIRFDETDLCWRIWLSGWRVTMAPKAVVYHKGSSGINPVALYFSRRNRIASILKNYSFASLVKYFSIYLLLLFAISFITRRKGQYLVSFMNALVWNIVHLRTTIRKRVRVQHSRKVSDRFLMRKGVIEGFDLRKMLKYGF